MRPTDQIADPTWQDIKDRDVLHKRWLKKAKGCFNFKCKNDGSDIDTQTDRALNLARDIWKTLDPKSWKGEG